MFKWRKPTHESHTIRYRCGMDMMVSIPRRTSLARISSFLVECCAHPTRTDGPGSGIFFPIFLIHRSPHAGAWVYLIFRP